tara:strand:+ start:3043 stop:3243 length:201 start_codon:yes stop_codon:yes gene_type:complete
VLRFLPCFFLLGCAITHNPQLLDTKFKDADRNWAKVYEHELKVALENDDVEAWMFFWPEYLKEVSK